jgi:hypothetical protein
MSHRLISLPPPRTPPFRHLGVLAAAWLLVAVTLACGRSVTNPGSKLADASSMDARNQDDRMIVDTLPNLKADAESPADSGLKTADASSADARNQDDRMTMETLPDLKPDGVPPADAAPPADSGSTLADASSVDASNQKDGRTVDTPADGKADGSPPDRAGDQSQADASPCQPGAKNCDGTTPVICDTSGVWQTQKACPYACVSGDCVWPSCQPGSIASQCNGNSPVVCDAAGTWQTGQPCPYICSEGTCAGTCVVGSRQCQGATVQRCDVSSYWYNETVCPGTCFNGACSESCVAGTQRCAAGLMAQTCTPAGTWQDGPPCRFCSGGTCAGECTPGSQRCSGNTVQTCSSGAAWVDQQICPASSPNCVKGLCVAQCLGVGQDCTDPQTTCCAGSECATNSSVSPYTTTCLAAPSCAGLGSACQVNTDCCAGLDCGAGKCVGKIEACMDRLADGSCAGPSAGQCCPGTVCTPDGAATGCAIPSTTRPQGYLCPRDRPNEYEPCSWSKFGMPCTYSDWVKEPGVFYSCTCSYHGWSCTQGYYVH